MDWLSAGYFNQHADKTDAFQVILISRPDLAPGAFQIEFNYNQIQWETGDASGGAGGLGGTSAYVGYGSGGANAMSFQMIGSGVPGSFLDSNPTTGLIANSLNSGVGGRYDFTILPTSPVNVTNPGDQTNNEGDPVALQIHATDPNGPLTYSATALPDGLTLDPNTGLISGVISAGASAAGPIITTITASDGVFSGAQTFNWTVHNPITITNPDNQNNNQGDTVSLQIHASDATGGTLSYSATGLPDGLQIDPTSGLISGQVRAGASYQTTVTAGDGTYSNSLTFNWAVSSPITITNPDTQSNTEGDLVSLQIQASDSSGGTLTYSAAGLPTGLTMDPQTGKISGFVAAGAGARAPYVTTVTATDGPNTARQSFTWNIASPVVVTNLNDQTNNEGDTVSLQIQASDSSNSPLTYAATGLPLGLAINPSTGLITGTIAVGAAAGGPFVTTVVAGDGKFSSSQTFNWFVNDPVAVTAPADQTNTEGDTVSLQVQASDSLSRSLSYSATQLPDGLSINPTTGLITGTVSPGAVNDGPFVVTVTANDGADSDSQTFLWSVNSYVTVSSISDQTNNEGDNVSLQVHATDPGNGTLTYSADLLPTGLSINTNTGLITGTVAAGAAATGPFVTTVTASDGTYSGSQTFNWNIDSAITFSSVSDQTNNEGDVVSLQLHATDATGGTVTYSAAGLPDGLTINATTGLITGTISAGAAGDGPFTPTITATDGTFSGSLTFNWNVNPAITITGINDQTNNEGDNVSLQVQASDSTGGTLTYSTTELPSGLGINAATGLITGTVNAGGSYQTTVTVSDGTYSNSLDFNWIVNSVSAVTIVPLGDQGDTEGDAVSLPIIAVDVNNANLTYSATGLPNGLGISSTTGVISGNISVGAAANGPFLTTVTATDGTATDRLSFPWYVYAAGPLTILSLGDQTNNQGDAVTLSITATDTAGGTVTFAATGLPNGLGINANTGVISGTVGAGGSYAVTVSATDGTNTDTQTFNWTVNSPVTVAGIDDQTNTEGDAVSLQVQAGDTNSGTISYSVAGLPNGLTMNATTGLISGTISGGDAAAGPFTVTVTAGDGTSSGLQTFKWYVGSPLTFSGPADQNNEVGDRVFLQLGADNTAANSITYSATGLPTGLSIDANTGLISGTVGTAGSFVATVTASDGISSNSQTFNWTVTNAAPVAVNAVSDQTNKEGDVISLQIMAGDSSGGTLSYDALDLPDGLTINATTGLITGTIGPGATGDGPYVVIVTASDGTDADSQMFNWNVSSPVALASASNQSNTEGDNVSLQLSASDSTGRTFVYASSGLPYGLQLNTQTGLITGTIAANAAASFTTTVTATDGVYSGSQTFTWTVVSPVTVTAISDQTNNEGDMVSLQVQATDSHGGTLTYAALGLPDGLSINPTTGLISGTIQVGTATTGTFSTTVLASDATYRGSQTFVWTIGDPIALTDPTDQSNIVGDTSFVQLTATDATGGTVSFSAVELPTGLSLNAMTGAITGTVNAPGLYSVAIRASDGLYSAVQTFNWYVASTVEADDPAKPGVYVKNGQLQVTKGGALYNEILRGSDKTTSS